MSKSTKEQMNTPVSGMIPSPWSRKTVADGSWMQKYTIGRLSARDDFLADAIDSGVSGVSAYTTTVKEDVNDVKGVVDELNDDVTELRDIIENLSPLTYKGTNDIATLKETPTTTSRNGWVYSLSGVAGRGEWFYPKADSGFFVHNGDDVAWVSDNERWFPIGQDIHVEYSAGENIQITENNTINVTDKIVLGFKSPITGEYDEENEEYVIRLMESQITANCVKVTLNDSDSLDRPITWYNSGSSALNYNSNVYINNTTLYSPTHKGINFSGTNATYDNITSNSITSNELNVQGNIFNDLSNNTTKNLILYYGNNAINQDSTYSSTNSPKIVWSGVHGSEGDSIASLGYAYQDKPKRFDTELTTAYYTSENKPGGWFNFTLSDANIKKAGVLADSFSSNTMITEQLTIAGNKNVDVSVNSGALLIGPTGGKHLLIDGDDIVAMNGNNTATLCLQYWGGKVVTPNLSCNYLTANTAYGASAKYTDISSTNLSAIGTLTASTARVGTAFGSSGSFTNFQSTYMTANNLSGYSIRTTHYRVIQQLFSPTAWNMGTTNTINYYLSPNFSYFNIWNPTGGASTSGGILNKKMNVTVNTDFDCNYAIISHAKGNGTGWYQLKIIIPTSQTPSEWHCGLHSSNTRYLDSGTLTNVKNSFGFAVDASDCSTHILVSPSDKFVIIKGGRICWLGAL